MSFKKMKSHSIFQLNIMFLIFAQVNVSLSFIYFLWGIVFHCMNGSIPWSQGWLTGQPSHSLSSCASPAHFGFGHAPGASYVENRDGYVYNVAYTIHSTFLELEGKGRGAQFLTPLSWALPDPRPLCSFACFFAYFTSITSSHTGFAASLAWG